ncbi:ATP-grasp domain-containing protein [Rhodohalobacter sp.]|uniref:ATP-grasp domain-containing protein n=1 Tax=Rhodohalobacter sp. TaxID=1974210 RepID=UPI002ACD530D|nr:ATP-grasp domain-containing protein [Rhodohalobacter sp.]MDZ7755203.1 ATP-grasp domain-containing protein [Rhodohalobacter sp.]
MKVIIPDAQSRKAFDIINILERKHGCDLLLFAPSGTNRFMRVIYGQMVHSLNVDNYEEFRNDLLSAIKADADEEYIWMAVSEEPTLLFYELMEKEPDHPIRYLLPGRDMFELARNKADFQKFCEENELPVPASFSIKDLQDLEQNFRPVIAKKRIGAGSVGMKYVESPDQLSRLNGISDREYLIQEKVESRKKIHGVFCLARNGELLTWHGHERIRTFPEKGGVTVYSRSVYIDELKEITEKLLKALNWSGFAMVEFLQDDRTGEWKIIELNPRLWGSVMLSEFCGSGLLINYVKLLKGENPESSSKLSERYIRWFFPFELISLFKGKIGFREFLNRKGPKTCYINFTYSSLTRALLFQFYFTFNGRSVKRFFKKLLP